MDMFGSDGDHSLHAAIDRLTTSWQRFTLASDCRMLSDRRAKREGLRSNKL